LKKGSYLGKGAPAILGEKESDRKRKKQEPGRHKDRATGYAPVGEHKKKKKKKSRILMKSTADINFSTRRQKAQNDT